MQISKISSLILLSCWMGLFCANVSGKYERFHAFGEAEAPITPELFVPSSNLGISNLTYSRDGSLLAGASLRDRTVKVFDARSNVELRAFSGHKGVVQGVVILPDNNTVVSGSDDLTVRFWSISTGAELKIIPVGEPVASMALSGNGQVLVIATNSKEKTANNFSIKLWDVQRAEWGRTWHQDDAQISAAAVTFDGKIIAAGDSNHIIQLWNAETGAKIRSLNIEKGTVQSLAFNREGTMLAGGSAMNAGILFANYPSPLGGGDAKIWEIATGELKQTLQFASVDHIVVAFHPDKKILATAHFSMGKAFTGRGRYENDVQLWNIETGKEERQFESFQSMSIAFNPDGKTIAAADQLAIKIFNTATGRVVQEIEGFADEVGELRFVRLNWLETAASMSGITTINLQKGAPMTDSECHPGKSFGDSFYSQRTRPYIVCSPAQKLFARIPVNEKNMVEVVDADSGNIIHRLPVSARSIKFSGEKTLVIWTHEDVVEMRDVESGEIRSKFNATTPKANWNWELSAGGRYLLTNSLSETTKTNDLQVYDTRLGKLLYVQTNFDLLGQGGWVFNPNEKSFAHITPQKITFYEFSSGRKLFVLPNNLPGNLSDINFSPDGKMFTSAGDSLKLWNAETGEEIATLEGHTGRVNRAQFSPDGKFIVSAGDDHTVKIWETATRKIKQTLTLHTAAVKSLAFSPDGTRLATSAGDARIFLWNFPDGSPVVCFIHTVKNGLITITPDNYYLAPRAALPAIAFRVGKRAVPVSQFDLKFNRPDIVLERLGNPDKELIKLYRNAYERRLQKMGFRENEIEAGAVLPEVRINTQNIPSTTVEAKLPLTVRVSDSQHRIARLSVFINDVPVFGSRGIDLTAKQTNYYEEKMLLELGRGRNHIEIFATNESGVESLREIIEIEYSSSDEVKPDLYVVVIGVSEYKVGANKLNYAAKDATDLADTIERDNIKAFNKIYTKRLLDADARRENILLLKEFLGRTKVGDQVIVFVSGHGLLDEKLNYYFATTDIDFLNPSERGVSYDEMENLLDGISSRKKLLLLDTCHAGEPDKEGLVSGETKFSSKPVITETGEGKISKYVPRDVRPTNISFDNTAEFLNEAFVDLRRGTGTAVLSAASAAEYAFESEKWKNGVFTFAILSGLKAGTADINRDDEIVTSELQQFVIDEVLRLTEGAQKPVVRRHQTRFDFAFSYKPNLLRKLSHNNRFIYALDWNSDGSRIATVTGDGVLRLWNAANGELERLIQTDAQTLNVAKWTQDDKTVAAGVWKNINYYNAATGELQRSIKTDNTYLSDFAFSADGQLVLANGDSHTAAIYKTATGELVHKFEERQSQIWCVSWSANGEFIATGEANGTISIWNSADKKLIHVLRNAHAGDVQVLDFYLEKNAVRLVSGGAEGTLRFWNPATGENTRTIKTENGIKGRVISLALSADEQALATGHADGTVRVWRLSDYTQSEKILAHLNEVNGIGFSPNGEILASAGSDGMVKLWKLGKPR